MTALLALLYAATGATSLIYQLVWSRALALALGGTLVPLAAVVAVFLTGLAAGAAAFGPLADRLRRPAVLYGGLELLVAAWASLTPGLAAWLRSVTLAGDPGPFAVIGWTALFLLPPTFLMGATFPCVLSAAAGGVRRTAAGVFYGANTLGAVFGVLAAAFFLLPRVGLAATVRVTALANALAGLAAIAWSLAAGPRHTAPPRAAPAAAGPPRPGDRRILLALALSGFAALLGEIAWTRALALVLGSSALAFALVLAAFLVGLALGSLAYARRSPTGDPRRDFVHYELRAALAAAAFAALLVLAPRLVIFVLRTGSGSASSLAAAAFAVAFLATGYATSALGAAFPAGLAALAPAGPAGATAGRAYGFDTAGAVAGALLASLVLIPQVGLATTLAAGVAVNLAAAALAAATRRHLAVAVAGSSLALLALPAWWRWNQEIVVSGLYANAWRYAPAEPTAPVFAARRRLPPRAGPRPQLPSGPPGFAFLRDGAHAHVAVWRDPDGELSLLIDGKPDASTARDGDMRTQLLLGHLPALLHPGRPLRALVIGLGSGVTASALLASDRLEIDVVEIEPAVAEAARRLFVPVNLGVLGHPGVHLHLADGRRWVARNANRYDMITSEPSNLWMAGVSSLFTAEFFVEAARALRPDGVLCQWMHLYQVAPEDVRIVLRGLLRTFPHAEAFLDGPDLLVVASRTPLRPLARVVPSPAVARDLARGGLEVPADLELLHVADAAGLGRFAASGPLHTDDRPLLEYSAPRSLARNRAGEIEAAILAAAGAP